MSRCEWVALREYEIRSMRLDGFMTDPSRPNDIADTAMFRAFVNEPEPEPAHRRIGAALIAVVVAVLIVVAVVVWLVLR